MAKVTKNPLPMNSADGQQPKPQPDAIVVNTIVRRTIDRTMKDIGTWREAHKMAERVIWPQRLKLYSVYSDIELDGHLQGLVKKRVRSIVNKRLFFKAADGSDVEEMETLLGMREFRNFRKLVMMTRMWGVSGAEFLPGKKFQWAEIPRTHIRPEHRIIAIEELGNEGIDYTKMPNVMVMGETYDLGEYLACAPYALWKRGGWADYAQFVEIFGHPVRVFTYDAYDIATKNQLADIIADKGSDLALMVPKQAEFEMVDGKTSNANGDLQTQFIQGLNQEMSVIMLGVTETTTSSNSSGYAQSKEHGKQQLEVVKDDMEHELGYLNSEQFMAILESYGYKVAGGKFCYEETPDENDLKIKMEVDEKLSKLVPLDDDYFYKTYHRPRPDNYDELKAKMEEQKQMVAAAGNQPPKPGKQPAAPKGKAQKPDDDEEEDGIEKEVDDLMAQKPGPLFKIFRDLADFFGYAPRD